MARGTPQFSAILTQDWNNNMLFLVGLVVASAFLRVSVGLNTAVINAPAVAPNDTSQAVKRES